MIFSVSFRSGKKPPANTISQALTSHTTAPKSPVSQSYQAPPSLPPYVSDLKIYR